MSHPVCQVCVFTLQIIKLFFCFFLNLLKASSKMYLQGLGGLLPVFVLFAVLIFCLILSCLGSVCKICHCASCLSPPLYLQGLFLLAKIFAPLQLPSCLPQCCPALSRFHFSPSFCLLPFFLLHSLPWKPVCPKGSWSLGFPAENTAGVCCDPVSPQLEKTSSAMLWDGAPSSNHWGCSALFSSWTAKQQGPALISDPARRGSYREQWLSTDAAEKARRSQMDGSMSGVCRQEGAALTWKG